MRKKTYEVTVHEEFVGGYATHTVTVKAKNIRQAVRKAYVFIDKINFDCPEFSLKIAEYNPKEKKIMRLINILYIWAIPVIGVFLSLLLGMYGMLICLSVMSKDEELIQTWLKPNVLIFSIILFCAVVCFFVDSIKVRYNLSKASPTP